MGRISTGQTARFDGKNEGDEQTLQNAAEQPATLAQDFTVLRNILNTLVLLQSHLRLVGETGANTVLATSRLFTFLEQIFAARQTLTFSVARHGFLFADTFIDRTNRNLEKFANLLFQHGIASLTITPEVAPQAIHSFLKLVNRKPSETWDEGGMPVCLRSRKVTGLVVGEMSEDYFELKDAASEVEPLPATTVLWEKYALAIAHGLHLADADAEGADHSPAAMAAAAGAALQNRTEEEKTAFARHAGRFLLSLKHEKVRTYRDATVRNLTTFINELPPDLRILFLTNVFNLNLDIDLAEDFASTLSDECILDAFKNAAIEENYTPPVILRLLGKLAANRGLDTEGAVTHGSGQGPDSSMLADLFRADGFADYVPERYQDALLRVVREDHLPAGTEVELDQLKQSLEPAAVEDHLGQVLLRIFQETPDAQHLTGMCGNLRNTVDFYLTTENFGKITELLQTIAATDPTAESAHVALVEHASSAAFIDAALDAVNRLGREKLEELATLILYLKEPFIVPLFARLNQEPNRSIRLVYLRLLKQIGPPCIGEAIRWLTDERWYVTRNMLFLLREIGDPTVLPEIRRYLTHNHAKVRQEALGACLLFRDDAAVGHLLRGFEAKEETEAIRAVTLAAQANDPQVIARLLETVQKSSLFDYRLELRRAAVRALAVHAPPEALPVFAQILASHDRLRASPHEQLKLEIVGSLGKYPTEPAAKLLRELVGNGSAKVAQVARLQLKKLTEGER